jgi:subtilisin family serine protease
MLALRVCPNADLYIAKVASDGDKIEKLAVIQALKWAISQKVDIVNMSFGWKEVDVGSLAEELRNARRTKTLLFAATSNYGLRNLNDVAYPAISQDPFVIGIDSANGAGAHSRNLNPPSNSLNNRKWRFTAPGEGVESAYPSKLESSGLKRLDGTSFASPIAAGVAAMVLEFALQPPLNLEPQIYQILKGDGFLWILHDLLSSKMADTLPFRFILPWQLFHGEELDNETVIGGSADKAGSPRRRAAERIVECLRVYLGVGNVGKEFYDKLNAPTAVKVDSSVSESIP